MCHVITEIEYDAPYYRYTDLKAPVPDIDTCSEKIVLRVAAKAGIPLVEVVSKLSLYSKA